MLKKIFTVFRPKISRFWPKNWVEWFFMIRVNLIPFALAFTFCEAGPWTAGIVFCLYVHLEWKDFKSRKEQRFFNKWVDSTREEMWMVNMDLTAKEEKKLFNEWVESRQDKMNPKKKEKMGDVLKKMGFNLKGNNGKKVI